jgi:glycosyltransferase involved in cell wall biosynthesis
VTIRISIVTPLLNQGRYITEAVESVRQKAYPAVEHLVMDGGSSDSTVEMLRGLNGNGEWKHIYWRSEPDSGQSDALNQGFKRASGDIVGWLNADDRYRVGCFDHVIKAFEENPAVDVFYGDYALINDCGKLVEVRREIEFNQFILLHHHVLYIATTTTFFRRRIFEEGNWLRPDLHYAMDYEFFLRLAAAGYCIQRIPQVLADFRIHPDSKSCRMKKIQLLEKERIMRSFSAITNRFESLGIRPAIFLGLQIAATMMRWSEKMLRGHYLVQYLATPREE